MMLVYKQGLLTLLQNHLQIQTVLLSFQTIHQFISYSLQLYFYIAFLMDRHHFSIETRLSRSFQQKERMVTLLSTILFIDPILF